MAYKAPIWEDGKSPAISAGNLNNLSQAAEGAQVLYGNSAPTSSTEGAVGQFYLVVVTDSYGNYPLYQCVAIANGSYVWRDTRRIPDSITSMLGIPAPGTISSALNVLAHVGNLHVWQRVQTYSEPVPEVPAGYTLGPVETDVPLYYDTKSNREMHVYKATTVNVDATGTVTIPTSSTATITYASATGPAGNYISLQSISSASINVYLEEGEVYYIPEDATFERFSERISGSTYYGVKVSKIQRVTGYPYTPAIPAGTTTDYLTSTDRNAYPDQSAAGGQDAYYTLGDVRGSFALTSLADASWIWAYSDNVIISDDGETVELDNPSTVSLSRISASTAADILIGKFFKFNMSGLTDEPYDQKIYYIPSDATITHAIPSGEKYYRFDLDKYQPVTGHAAIPANTTITYLGQLGGGARIEVGSYVGTETYGKSNPNTLTFGFEPQLVAIFDPSGNGNYAYKLFMLRNVLGASIFDSDGNNRGVIITWSEKSVSWYSSSSTYQMNYSGSTYNYIAIG